ncbi:hypothetical protein C8R45DRAFT_1110327 [Mycena sanguinolenta]|nr:hypothetical protein C8R45DRAFT_1110327 [Mycena sanguinolenta]
MKFFLLSSVLTALAAVANATLTCTAACSAVSNGYYTAIVAVTISPIPLGGAQVVRFHCAVSALRMSCLLPSSLVGGTATLKTFHMDNSTDTQTATVRSGVFIEAYVADLDDQPVSCGCDAGTP